METTVCAKCGQEKPVEMFAKNKTRKDGLCNWCRECNSIYKAQYRAEHKEEICIAKKKCYEAKKEQYLQHIKENYYKHQKERIAYSVKWGKENKERRNATHRKHRAENLEMFREKERKYRETHKEQIKNYARKTAWNVSHPFCKELEKVENYELAKADNFVGWDRHHRLETHNSDGEKRLVDLSIAELKALDMYYDRPPEEIIWLRSSEHTRLHMKKNADKRL
jgi:hypothetical protein